MQPLPSNHLLKIISCSFPGLLAYLDKNQRYLFINNHYQEWYGLESTNVLGQTPKELLGEEIYSQRKDKILRVLNGEKLKYLHNIHHQKLGWRIVEQIYEPDFDSNGEVIGFLAMAYDITERVSMEKRAKENESRFRSLTEVMPQLVWLSDADGKFIFINNNWPRVTGTLMEENLGHGWMNTIHPDDRMATLLNWEKALNTGEVFETEYRIKKYDGSYGWYMARGIPIKNDLGQIERWVGTTTDIESQKNAKDLAIAERKRIYSLFMQSPVNILVLEGPEHVVELINPAARAYFNGKDITGFKIKDALVDDPDSLALIEEVYQTGISKTFKSMPVVFKSLTGKEKIVYYDLFYEPIKDDAGKTTGILNLGVDVTEQVMAFKRAEKSEELFRTYAESMPQMAFIADSKGDITYLNRRWDEFAGPGWKREEIQHPEDREAVRNVWHHSLETNEPFELEYRLLRKDGVYRWQLARALPLRDSLGHVTQWVGTVTDIHDQKEFEAVQSRILQILDSSSDFVSMMEPSGKVFYINRAGKEMLGLEENEEIGNLKNLDFFYQEDLSFVNNVIYPTTMNEGKWVGDIRLRNLKNDEERWVHYNSFITHDVESGAFTGFATISRDLTEMKQKERKLEEALVARDQFLSIASHELKTPLTSLKLQSQLSLRYLQAGKVQSKERQFELANQANEMVGRLTRLIDDMLDVSRIRTGKLQLDNSKQELGDIVREVVFRMSPLFEAANLNLPSIEIKEELVGDWDRFRLEQVIGNLLTNAIRYGKGKSIEIKLERKFNKALLKITDHGYGIAEKDLERIFGRFERAISSSEVSGMGLGLFISKEIVETQKGKIWVHSELNKGSTFCIELPLKEGEASVENHL